MAHHKSALKRIRQTATRRIRNRYHKKTTRNAIKVLRRLHDKTPAKEMLPSVVSMIDKLAKKNLFHKNKAANLKSKLTKFVNRLHDHQHHH
jgi:small subunit ribosomal protein S20